jgi:hypothetical protein
VSQGVFIPGTEAAEKALNETHRVAALQPFGNRQGYETVPFVY